MKPVFRSLMLAMIAATLTFNSSAHASLFHPAPRTPAPSVQTELQSSHHAKGDRALLRRGIVSAICALGFLTGCAPSIKNVDIAKTDFFDTHQEIAEAKSERELQNLREMEVKISRDVKKKNREVSRQLDQFLDETNSLPYIDIRMMEDDAEALKKSVNRLQKSLNTAKYYQDYVAIEKEIDFQRFQLEEYKNKINTAMSTIRNSKSQLSRSQIESIQIQQRKALDLADVVLKPASDVASIKRSANGRISEGVNNYMRDFDGEAYKRYQNLQKEMRAVNAKRTNIDGTLDVMNVWWLSLNDQNVWDAIRLAKIKAKIQNTSIRNQDINLLNLVLNLESRQNNYNNIRRNINSFNADINEFNRLIEQQKSRQNLLRSEVSQFEQQLEASKEKLDSYDTEIITLDNKINDLESEYDRLDNSSNDLPAETVESYLIRMSTIEAKLPQLRNELKSLRSIKSTNMNQIQKRIADLNQKMTIAKSELASSKETESTYNASMQRKIGERRASLNAQEIFLNEARVVYQQIREGLRGEANLYTSEVKELDIESDKIYKKFQATLDEKFAREIEKTVKTQSSKWIWK